MGRYVAIHWRFDKRDWQHHCEVKEDNYYCELVTKVRDSTPYLQTSSFQATHLKLHAILTQFIPTLLKQKQLLKIGSRRQGVNSNSNRFY